MKIAAVVELRIPKVVVLALRSQAFSICFHLSLQKTFYSELFRTIFQFFCFFLNLVTEETFC